MLLWFHVIPCHYSVIDTYFCRPNTVQALKPRVGFVHRLEPWQVSLLQLGVTPTERDLYRVTWLDVAGSWLKWELMGRSNVWWLGIVFWWFVVDPNKSHTQVRNKNLGRAGRLLKLKLVESCDPSGWRAQDLGTLVIVVKQKVLSGMK